MPERLGTEAPFPQRTIKPMRLYEVKGSWSIPRDLDNWFSENKWRGIRALIYIVAPGQIYIVTQEGNDVTAGFPELLPPLTVISHDHTAVLDNEIIAGEGKTKKEETEVIRRVNRIYPQQADIRCFAFDLLYQDSFDLKNVPLFERKSQLDELFAPYPNTNIGPTTYTDDHAETIEQAKAFGSEGIVLKKKDSPYVPNIRRAGPVITPHYWLKIKRGHLGY